MGKPKKATQKIPDRLYVVMESDGDDTYPIAYPNVDAIDDGAVVGIFDLTKTMRMKLEREFVEIKK